MEPNIDLDTILANMSDTVTLSLSGANDDTITLSRQDYSNSTIYNSTAVSGAIFGGGYTYPNTISVTGGPYTISGGAGNNDNNLWSTYTASPKIKLDGEGADIEVNGWSLIDAIQKIEERLNILHPNTELETEWEELRALGKKYRELEQHIEDKQATWDRLKAMPAPDIE